MNPNCYYPGLTKECKIHFKDGSAVTNCRVLEYGEHGVVYECFAGTELIGFHLTTWSEISQISELVGAESNSETEESL